MALLTIGQLLLVAKAPGISRLLLSVMLSVMQPGRLVRHSLRLS
jgi:hypothetical protein